MKQLFTFLFTLTVFLSFGQRKSGITFQKMPIYTENSEIKVIYPDSIHWKKNKNSAAYFINNKYYTNSSFIESLNPKKIDSVNIAKGNFKINRKIYNGKILVYLKPNYKPVFLTLKELSEKHLKITNSPILFQIDYKTIQEDFNEYFVDESFILKIIVTNTKITEIDKRIYIINIITKTPENIKKANNIILRG